MKKIQIERLETVVLASAGISEEARASPEGLCAERVYIQLSHSHPNA